MYKGSILWWDISRQDMRSDPRKAKAITDMPPPKSKKEFQTFLVKLFEQIFAIYSWGMQVAKMTHISTDRVDEEWELPKLFNKAKALIKADDCMKCYDETRLLYLQTDAS